MTIPNVLSVERYNPHHLSTIDDKKYPQQKLNSPQKCGDIEVSKHGGTHKSSMFAGIFSTINHPSIGVLPF